MVIAFIAVNSLSGMLYSQSYNSENCTFFEQKLAGHKVGLYPGPSIGSSYLNDEWCLGNIHLAADNWVKNKQLKYNSFTDELLWLRPSDYSMILLEKDQILEFTINLTDIQKHMHFKKMNIMKTDSAKTFYQILHDDKYALYCQRKVIQTGEAARSNGFSAHYLPVLKKAPVYIISSKSGELMILEKISNRALIKSNNHKKDVLKNFLRDSHLHMKTEEDLISFVELMEDKNLLF